MMEAARTYETPVDNYFTRQYIPEDNSILSSCANDNENISLPSETTPYSAGTLTHQATSRSSRLATWEVVGLAFASHPRSPATENQVALNK
jgi:hypothetical protein